ncbi:tellurite resistance TerB family protein [Microvirga lenta]|uniref:tellurite resistance TerB family protein n=1 Tax=Microvirga lenta TaxID=2881337 RepID=UPI001CFFBB50|nr:tellurite resistance TerB family protein [Microvirga lenta]MCB5177345.1 tellurite resistance TerB family protein [Microvirga lenta]
MVDYRKLLDAVVGALSRPGQHQGGQGGLAGLGRQVETVTGQSPDQLLQKAKDVAAQNPELTQAAIVGLAGLMFTRGRKSGLTGNLAKLGGLALIGGLAYRAYQSRQAGQGAQTTPEGASAGSTAAEISAPQDTLELPETSRFHPVSQTEDDALLFLRTMVAAASADGQIDETERGRIVKGLTEAGIDPQATRWLESEMTSPADVEELAATVDDPEKAAQVYAAARIAIDPDTIQEREFLHQLAEALDLDQALRAQIDDTASSMR